MRLNADVEISRGFPGHDRGAIDVDDGRSAVDGLGCDRGNGRIFGGLVILDDETAADVRFTSVNADPFVLAIANEDIFYRDVRAECVDSIIINIGYNATEHRASLAGPLAVDIDAVGIIVTVHFRDPAILEP